MKIDDYEHTLERGEWAAWRDEMQTATFLRRPLYGDFGTQPSTYAPSPPFPGSPSVRYTTAENFVILRGRGGSAANAIDFRQYIGHALYLREQQYFEDVIETAGDAYVHKIASQMSSTGNLTTWRVASLERHIAVVSSQIKVFAGSVPTLVRP